jgi:hypothetical protein
VPAARETEEKKFIKISVFPENARNMNSNKLCHEMVIKGFGGKFFRPDNSSTVRNVIYCTVSNVHERFLFLQKQFKCEIFGRATDKNRLSVSPL